MAAASAHAWPAFIREASSQPNKGARDSVRARVLRPARRSRKVVLPAPLAPISAVRTPGRNAPVIPFSSSSSLTPGASPLPCPCLHHGSQERSVLYSSDIHHSRFSVADQHLVTSRTLNTSRTCAGIDNIIRHLRPRVKSSATA